LLAIPSTLPCKEKYRVSYHPETSARQAPAAAPARRPGTLTTAIIMSIVAGLSGVVNGVIVGDVTNGSMAGLVFAAILFGLVAIVMTWLPANGRYAKRLAA
jgi:hypothetical protein